MKRVLSLCILMCLGAGSSFAQDEQRSTPKMQNADPAFQEKISQYQVSDEAIRLMDYWLGKKKSIEAAPLENVSMQIRYERVSRAPKDGCFFGIGNPENSYSTTELTTEECTACESKGGRVKTNQSYVWGLTRGNDKVIWGTINNYFCLRAFEQFGSSAMDGMPQPPTDNSCYVCEFEEAASHDKFSDWQPPRFYNYDVKTKVTTDITPDIDNIPLQATQGIRSAGTLGNISFLGGPCKKGYEKQLFSLEEKPQESTPMPSAISFFAYDNSKPVAEFIGSWLMESLPGFEDRMPFNIRRWTVANDELYFGVQWMSKTINGVTGGAILRWKKEAGIDQSKNIADLFEVVGWTKGGVSEIVFHNNHLYATTWPSCTLCKSPDVNDKLPKVTDVNDKPWDILFSYSQYDPDPVVGNTGLGGAMTVYQGQIYFGTLHMPILPMLMAAQYYGIDMEDEQKMLEMLIATFRSATLFRYTEGEQFENGYNIELLYGEEELPAYDMNSKKWVNTSTGFTPLFGKSGFGNIMNNYCWSMDVHNDKLYIGTMDWGESIGSRLDEMLADQSFGPILIAFIRELAKKTEAFGFDFLRMESPNEAAKMISSNGLGIETQYGIRNMTHLGDYLYLGTANPYNVHEHSGWELIEVSEGTPRQEVILTWEPANLNYGELPNENQLNAQVTNTQEEPIPGVYEYTVMYKPVENIDRLNSGTYNLRLKFTPDNKDEYPEVTAKKDLLINKAVLEVLGDTIKMEADEELPTEYTYKMKGFVFDDDESDLTEKPTATADVPVDKQPGSYQIVVQGGKSDNYDFNYKNGLLVIQVPTNLEQGVENAFAIYPIPFKNEILIESKTPIRQVVVNDMTGAEVFRIANPDSKLNLSHLSAGIYVMSIETENGTIVRKVTKAE